MTEDEARGEYIELLPHLREFASFLRAHLEAAADLANSTLHSRLRSWESIRPKLGRLAVTHLIDLPDLVGLRLIVPSPEALHRVSESVRLLFFVSSFDVVHLRPGESSTRLIVHSAQTPLGRLSAEVQILTEAEEARRALTHEQLYKGLQGRAVQDRAAPQPADLQRIVAAFRALIEKPGVHEKRDVHPFLKQNEFLLAPNPDSCASEVPLGLGTEFRIDFLLRRPDGTYLLVEIENPQAPIVTAAGDFSAATNHAVCQIEDWQEWIETNLQTVDRYYPGIRSPEGWIIIGRDSAAARSRIGRRNINTRGHLAIKTYDDVLRDAEAYVRSMSRALSLVAPAPMEH